GHHLTRCGRGVYAVQFANTTSKSPASRRKPGSTYPLPNRRKGGSRRSPGRLFFWNCLSGVIRKYDRRDEGPGLDKGGLVGLPSELLHGAQQAEPVQHLVLPRFFDLLGRIAVPGRLIAGFERVVEPAVGRDIGPELPILLGQERMRPARRCDKRGAPRALRPDPCRGGADLHAALRV